MTILQPAMLWSLAILAPLVAIYFLKVRPRRKPTTAYFLWEKIFQERRASSLFQRLRDAWSLILMALAAAAVCFALARPEWSDDRKDLVVVLDTSASMSAETGGASRLAKAKQVAREIVAGLNGSQLGAIATLGQDLTYRSHLTENPRELIEAIDAIEPTGEGLNLSAIPAAAASKSSPEGDSQRTDREHRVLLISDGAFDAKLLPPHVELLKVGAAGENVGIVAADLAYIAGSNRLGFYYQVASTFAEPLEADLILSTVDSTGQEQLFKVIPLKVAPGTNDPETFQLENAPSGRWLAKLEVTDALASDNVAHLAVARPEPVSVGVESADPYFLEKSVQAFAGGEGLLNLVGKEDPPPAVVLAKSTSPSAASALIFQPAGESPWWSDLGDEVEAGAAQVLAEGHPALRHLDAGSIPLVGARQLSAPPGAQILVADDRGLPIIYKTRRDERTAIVVNIDPVAADFYFSAWFPVLVHSVATHLAGRENALAASYRPKQAAPIPGGREEVLTTITLPVADGANPELAKSDTLTQRGAWFAGGERLGFYQLANPTGEHEFGVNVCNAQESLINGEQSVSRHDPLSRGRSPAQWLTLLAILLLGGESILYHRRKVG